jgi:hypothetical protein
VTVFGYRYYVLVSNGFSRESYALIRVRRGQSGVEGFTPGVGWEPSSRVSFELVENDAVAISGAEVERYQRLLAEREEESRRKGYTYYFVSADGFPTDQPVWLVRKQDTGWTATGEERFTKDLRWEKSDMLYRIESGREYDEAKQITEAEAQAYLERVTRMMENGEL